MSDRSGRVTARRHQLSFRSTATSATRNSSPPRRWTYCATRSITRSPGTASACGVRRAAGACRRNTSACSTRWSTCGPIIRPRRPLPSTTISPRPAAACQAAATCASTTTTPWSSRRGRAAAPPTGTRTRRTGAWIRSARSRPGSRWTTSTVDNGCLHFVPGSHRYGRQEPIALTVEGESIIDRMRERGFSVAEPVSMEMAAGGVTFHHGCTFHYAGPNRTDNPRRAFAIIYIPGLRNLHRRKGRRRCAGRDEGRRTVGPSPAPDPGRRSLNRNFVASAGPFKAARPRIYHVPVHW